MSASVPVIDAHHHLWRYTPHEFDWLDEPMATLRRDYTPADLACETAAAAVDGTVAVQARQSLEETRWLCGLAEGSALLRGVVGWAPIAAPDFAHTLAELVCLPRLVGLRHGVQGEPAGFLDGSAFNHGITLLPQAGLTYDLLLVDRQLEQATRFVDRHPRQPFVLDHLAKPPIARAELEPWSTHIRALARRPHVLCKLSGMVTEADWHNWSLDSLRPYLDVCVESFGPARLMAGSDWPVCLVASSYTRWWTLLRQYFAAFPESERAAIFGGNAIKFYGLDRPTLVRDLDEHQQPERRP